MNKIALILTIVMSFILTACNFDGEDDTWVVGTSADNPPYEYMESGKIVGFDIDFITEVARHLGKKVEFKNMEFHSLLAALSTKNVDLVVAGMSITNDRMKRVDFSIPYTSAKVAILYRKADQFAKPADFANKKVAGQLGSIFSIIAHQMAVDYKSKVSSLSSNLMLVEELKTKRIDGVVLETSQAVKFSSQHKGLDYFEVEEYGSSFAVVLPKGSKLKSNIDHTIKSLRKNGKLEELERKWGIISASKGL